MRNITSDLRAAREHLEARLDRKINGYRDMYKKKRDFRELFFIED
jgi:hypothetical protein